MKTLWFITNPASGSATLEKCEALEAVFSERGLALAGRTAFPDDDLPEGKALDAAGVDTVVLFAGDGTINAAVCALADWGGSFLILPGGTMNLLAKTLHGASSPDEIVHAVSGETRRVALPFVQAGSYRAFVAVILGPATRWQRAREALRERRFDRVRRAIGGAWRKTFARGLMLANGPQAGKRHQAVIITPLGDGLDIAAIDARSWGQIAELGWTWLTGDWLKADAVGHWRQDLLRVAGARPTRALFDGEEVLLDAGTNITGGTTEPSFIATIEPA